jgi:hypothetical protein
MSHSAASSGQYRPAWKPIDSMVLTCSAMDSGSRPVNSGSNGSKPSIVSPEPYPVTPSSVSTVTRVASKWRRGTGSQAGWKGGSRGSRIRSSRMLVILIRG